MGDFFVPADLIERMGHIELVPNSISSGNAGTGGVIVEGSLTGGGTGTKILPSSGPVLSHEIVKVAFNMTETPLPLPVTVTVTLDEREGWRAMLQESLWIHEPIMGHDLIEVLGRVVVAETLGSDGVARDRLRLGGSIRLQYMMDEIVTVDAYLVIWEMLSVRREDPRWLALTQAARQVEPDLNLVTFTPEWLAKKDQGIDSPGFFPLVIGPVHLGELDLDSLVSLGASGRMGILTRRAARTQGGTPLRAWGKDILTPGGEETLEEALRGL